MHVHVVLQVSPNAYRNVFCLSRNNYYDICMIQPHDSSMGINSTTTNYYISSMQSIASAEIAQSGGVTDNSSTGSSKSC